MTALAAAALALAFVPSVLATGDQTPGGEQCFSGTSNPDVKSHITWTTGSSGTTIRVTFSKNFVDNTYGANSVGWPGSKGHQFKQLVGSDHVILALYNGDGDLSLQPKIDYISQDSSVSSGYKTLGVSGGDGDMIVGDESDILSVETSESTNFNTYGYVLTVDSPATGADYTPNSAYPNWIYDVWYEVTVDPSAFGPSGFGHADMTWVHASPSKTGSNSEEVAPAPCPPPTPCPNGDMPNEAGDCTQPCPNGDMPNEAGECQPCANGETPNEAGDCTQPCPNGEMPNEAGECGQPCSGDDMGNDTGGDDTGGSDSGSCTTTTAPIPVFPTTASLVLGSVGAVGGAFLLLRRKK